MGGSNTQLRTCLNCVNCTSGRCVHCTCMAVHLSTCMCMGVVLEFTQVPGASNQMWRHSGKTGENAIYTTPMKATHSCVFLTNLLASSTHKTHTHTHTHTLTHYCLVLRWTGVTYSIWWHSHHPGRGWAMTTSGRGMAEGSGWAMSLDLEQSMEKVW